ncbi:MAG TPA: efflux RND transporter periplasmic adaptor subunit [Methylophilaceae bacterium]|nr:efflux RND transporter periplasmic adaptor subunit [Methylophilaceae bacterium]
MPSDRPTSAPSRHALRIGGLVALVVAGAVVVTGIATRANSDEKLKQWTMEQAVPNVSVILPSASGELSSIDLPARFEAYSRAPIYARVNGYLRNWHADIGTRVKAGQVLAEVETPDLDQKLLQAKADLATAKANEALAKTTAERWVSLLDSGAVSPQEVDEKNGDHDAKQAMTKAAQANVDRLLATRDFARIVAPFDGTVTARNTDTGALITEGSNNGPALFEISDTRKLRLYVNVPQNYVGSIKPGTTAGITVPEQPGKTYAATVESSSRAVDAASGAMLVQLIVDNKDAALLPGGYANVNLRLPKTAAALSIPSSALIFDKAGLRVATVDAENKAKLKAVTLARDLGKTVELSSGIAGTDRVIENPPDGIADGQALHVAKATEK